MGLGFFASIIVGGLAGWIGSRIMDAKTGIFVNILLGIIGALVANVILGLLGTYAANAWLPQLVVGTLGAIIMIAVGRAIRR